MPDEVLYLLRISLAAVLSLLVGVEREYFHKAAGIRTATLVGTGSALFMVISKYGFADTQFSGSQFDGSRVAAQIVSGVGFLGAGLIFVRQDAVRGLTTAASIWVVAGIGMAAGAGDYVVACGVTVLYLLVAAGIKPLSDRMPHSKTAARTIRVTYPDGRGMLRTIMEMIGSKGIIVIDMQARGVVDRAASDEDQNRDNQVQQVEFQIRGVSWSIDSLLQALNDLGGVSATTAETQWD